MKKIILVGSMWVLSMALASSQVHHRSHRGLPFQRDSDRKILQSQTDSFYKAIAPLSKKLGVYGVNVYSSGEMVSRGTVTEAGVLTKWSELVSKGRKISVLGHDGVKRDAFVKAVYEEYDLALLDYGGGLPAVDLSQSVTPAVGQFILSVGPAKDSHGFGVVSVEPRSLREKDKAFLGVRMESAVITDGGVRLRAVERGGAAAKAGLQSGDVILKVNQQEVNGIHEMGSVLQKLKPGEKVLLHFRRGKVDFSVDVELGARPEFKKYIAPRMRQMKRMGGSINAVAEGFPDVLQSDMQVSAIDAGGPVFDLEGRFVGTIVARASRMKTYIVTADRLAEQFSKAPDLTATAEDMKAADQKQWLSAAEVEEVKKLREVIKQAQRRLLELEGR